MVVLLLPAEAFDNELDRDVIAGYRLITNGPDRVGMALEITQLSHRKIDENAIDARQRVDGAVTPSVLTCKERLNICTREGEGGEEGGSAASVAISGCGN